MKEGLQLVGMGEFYVLVHVRIVRTLFVAQVANVTVLQLDLVDVDKVEHLLATLLERARHQVASTAAATATAAVAVATTAVEAEFSNWRSVEPKT